MASASETTDIVTRLREGRTDRTHLRWTVTDIHREAAAKIEQLCAALAEANDAAEANAAWGGRMKQERDALRDAWLRVIQAENTCAVTGRPCDAKRCGCQAEQDMLILEATDAE